MILADDLGMVDIFVALGISFVLAFVVSGPKARRAPVVQPSAKPGKGERK